MRGHLKRTNKTQNKQTNKQKNNNQVGGGIIPDKQRGVVLDGLVSNVDWFPTILSFANIVPTSSKHSYVGDSNQISKIEEFYSSDDSITEMDIADTVLVFDGYNIYDYIMNLDGESNRDHVLFHIQPTTEKDDEDSDSTLPILTKRIGEYGVNDFREIALIFYDDDGTLWKYFDVSKSTNPIGNPGINSGWCTVTTSDMANDPDALIGKNTSPDDADTTQALDTSATYTLVMDGDILDYGYLRTGLFDITNDLAEENNYLASANTEDIVAEIPANLLSIIQEKVDYYTNKNKIDGSLNSNAVYGSVDCFTMDDTLTTEGACLDAALENGAWVPFYTVEEWREQITNLCGIEETHPLYALFNSELELPDVLISTDNSAQVSNLNTRVIEDQSSQKRKFEDFTSKFSLDDLSAVDDDDNGDADSDDDVNDDEKMHADMDMDGINSGVIVDSRLKSINQNKNNGLKTKGAASSKNERYDVNIDKSGLTGDESILQTSSGAFIMVIAVVILFAVVGVVGGFVSSKRNGHVYVPLK